MLQTNQSEPIYWQLFARLRQDIEYGVLPPGECLPSERKLAAYHGVSRLTARKALQLLIQQGYARARQGKGTYVSLPFAYEAQPAFKSFVEYLQVMGVETSVRFISKDVVPASHCHIPSSCADDEKLIHIQKLFLGDGIPLALATAHLRYTEFYPLLTLDIAQIPFHTMIIQVLGTADLRVRQIVRTVLANEAEARLLGLELPAVFLQLQRIFYDVNGRYLGQAQALYRGDCCYLDLT